MSRAWPASPEDPLMRLLHLLLVIGLGCPFAIAIGGCGLKMSATMESEPGQAAGEGKGRGPEGKKQDAPATPRKIIYTASVRLIVEDW
jgi:hypothetical protein